MAAHVRTQIRNALVTLLQDLPSSGERVYPGRVSALDELPARVVHTDDESIEASDIHGPAELLRTLTVSIDHFAQYADGLEDELDEMLKETEHAVAADPTLGGIFSGVLTPAGIEIDRSGEGDAPIGRLTLRYLAQYEVANNAVDTPLA